MRLFEAADTQLRVPTSGLRSVGGSEYRHLWNADNAGVVPTITKMLYERRVIAHVS
jgi:hypothetical protein